MKKISAVFDGLKFSASTLSYAIDLAKASGATLSGVFLESFLYHSYDLQNIINQEGMLQAKIKKHIQQDKKQRKLATDLFENTCKAAKLKYNIHRDQGISMMEAVRESIYSDLLVVNSNDSFSSVVQHQPSLFIRELLAEVVCPLLIVPNSYHQIQKVILLYDGKPKAVTAIKMFHHLFTWLKHLPIHVLSVTPAKHNLALPDKALMDEFINCHYPHASNVVLHGDPAQLIIDQLSRASADTLVVMGANQRSQIARLFKPSLADKVLEQIQLPIFIVNN